MSARIIVIGGGVTGAFAAYFLAAGGAEPVLVERDAIAAGASGHNAGGLNPLHGPGIPGPLSELALQALALHLAHWERIARLSGIDFAGRFVERLVIARSEEEAAELAGRTPLYDEAPGLAARWLEPGELRRAEPRARADAVGALLTEGNARVDPAAYTRAVAGAARALGAQLVTGEVCGLRARGARATAVELGDGRVLDCDGVVVATGPWCEAPAQWLSTALPVTPVKGDLLLTTAVQPPLPAEVTWAGVGIYHAAGASLWLGGTEQRAGFDPEPSASARAAILTGVAGLMPGLAAPEIAGHVSGLRPVTPDGRPIVGIPAVWENVCVATGAGRKGMLFGAALGLAAAELLTTGSSTLAVVACGPDRWGTR